jgi:hypothetical protein
MIYYLVALTLVTSTSIGPTVSLEGQTYNWYTVDVYKSMAGCERAAVVANKNKPKTRFVCAGKDYN